MKREPAFLTAGEASRHLGVSAKALRVYEQRGLIVPGRTRAGWRVYGPTEMERAKRIISLRKLEVGLTAIATLLEGDVESHEAALARHRSRLQSRLNELGATLNNVGSALSANRHGTPHPQTNPAISFALPWPWDGERFELAVFGPLTFITGPLGSGKTRFAIRLAEALPGGQFLGLNRSDAGDHSDGDTMENDAERRNRCRYILRQLEREGATISPALTILIFAVHAGQAPLVIDMVEQGLDHKTQQVLVRHLRHREHPARPLFLMTRSSAILDLSLAESGETILYCPANHAPPLIVHFDPLCSGYDAVATCLATPAVRARTSGVVVTWETETLPYAR